MISSLHLTRLVTWGFESHGVPGSAMRTGEQKKSESTNSKNETQIQRETEARDGGCALSSQWLSHFRILLRPGSAFCPGVHWIPMFSYERGSCMGSLSCFVCLVVFTCNQEILSNTSSHSVVSERGIRDF